MVLFPDSFAARGLGAQCSAAQRSLRSGRERVVDVEAARRFLQAQSYVAADRVSLIGWANGGVAALWTVRPGAARKDGKPDFRSAVAFYPGCRRLRDTAWATRLPTLILIGEKDDWTPAGPCEQMVAGARGRTARATIHVYPGAYHDFDDPDLPLQQRFERGARDRADRPRACGHRPCGARGCAQARAGVDRALGCSALRTEPSDGCTGRRNMR